MQYVRGLKEKAGRKRSSLKREVKIELTDELLSYWERLAEENNNYRLSLHIETLKEIREIKALLKEQTDNRNIRR